MRILHTADWHIGKRLDYYKRLDEQEKVLSEIQQIALKENVDLILISGDLFDTFNPPNAAEECLYKTLKKMAQNGKIPVIAIAGNHDSPDRINIADVLARENGLILIGNPNDEVPLFKLEDGFEINKTAPGFIELNIPNINYPIRIIHTAFANEVRLKEYFGENKQQSLQDSLKAKWEQLATNYCDDKGVNLLITHLYMMKRGSVLEEEPEGEKPLNIGNADIVYSDAIPKAIQYAALGHLHRYQDVGVNQPVVYSGSPLAYSFAESGQQKFVNIIDVEPNKTPKLKQINLKEGKPLIRKTFSNVDKAIEWLSLHQNALVELTVEQDKYLKSEDRKRIEQTHDGIIYLIPKIKNKINDLNNTKNIEITDIDSLFKDFFKIKNAGVSPNEDIMDLFKEILSYKNDT